MYATLPLLVVTNFHYVPHIALMYVTLLELGIANQNCGPLIAKKDN